MTGRLEFSQQVSITFWQEGRKRTYLLLLMIRARYIHSPLLQDLLSCSKPRKKKKKAMCTSGERAQPLPLILLNSLLDDYHDYYYLQHER